MFRNKYSESIKSEYIKATGAKGWTFELSWWLGEVTAYCIRKISGMKKGFNTGGVIKRLMRLAKKWGDK